MEIPNLNLQFLRHTTRQRWSPQTQPMGWPGTVVTLLVGIEVTAIGWFWVTAEARIMA